MNKAELLCQPLRSLLQGGPSVFGKISINEFSFYQATTCIKRAVGFMIRGIESRRDPVFESQMNDLEEITEAAHTRFFGWVVVPRHAIEERLAEVAATLRTRGHQSMLCHPLRDVIGEGKSLWKGRVAFKEEDFYAATVRLKKAMTPASESRGPGAPQGMVLVTALDNIEGFVEKQGAVRMFGKALVDKAVFERHIEEIYTLLSAAEAFLPSSPTCA